MLDQNKQKYTAGHLRLQTVAYAAQNYKNIEPVIREHIDIGFKDWCQVMMDPKCRGDFPCLMVMQRMTKVSLISFLLKFTFLQHINQDL